MRGKRRHYNFSLYVIYDFSKFFARTVLAKDKNQQMKKYPGIFSSFGFNLPLKRRLLLIKKSGFKSTFIFLGEEKELIKQYKTGITPKLIRSCNLYLEHAHASYEDANLVWSDIPHEQEKIKTYYKNCIKFCSKYKIPYLVVHPTKSSSPPPFNESGLKIFKDLTLFAKDKNIKIAIENTRINEYVNLILENIKSKNIGLCYDTSHDHLYGNPTFELLQKWSKRIFLTHISDNSGKKDSHFLPWEGTFDWEKFADIFSSIKYNGILTLEVFPEKNTLNPVTF